MLMLQFRLLLRAVDGGCSTACTILSATWALLTTRPESVDAFMVWPLGFASLLGPYDAQILGCLVVTVCPYVF